MSWFRNLRTVLKIFILAAVMLVLMLIIAGSGYSTSTTIAVRMQDMYNNYAKMAMRMTEAKYLAAHSRRMILSMMLTDDKEEINSYVNRVQANRKAVAEIASQVKEELLPPNLKEINETLKKIGPEYRRLQDEAIAAGVGRDVDIAQMLNRLNRRGDIANLENEYVTIQEKFAQALVKEADEVSAMADNYAKRGAVKIIIVSCVALLTGLSLSVLIARMITGPIRRIQASVDLFAGGDLVSVFPTAGKDELGMMGRGLQKMADDLRRIIGSVKEASVRILDTSQEFSALAQETSASVGEFRTNVDDMGTSLNSLASTGEEVNASVEEVAAGSQATAEKGTDIATRVENAMKAGENGMSSVRLAVSSIEGVVGNASSTAKSVQELGERTRQIQNFVTQIGGIADQTNLLALNAAIEAARAGEAGRGFAVVAEEVRKLAEESNVAAKSIENLAKTIMGDLDVVVNMSLENAKASEGAKDLSKETEQVIGSMISYLNEISAATQDLAAVSEEQAASSEEIAEAIQNIADRVQNAARSGENIRSGAEEVSVAANRMASGSEGLATLAGELEQMLEFFKLELSRPESLTPGSFRMGSFKREEPLSRPPAQAAGTAGKSVLQSGRA
ncbi:MAG: methyl-accepting chemotaxis protein [Synergistaceae bacterium]|jgi:methyl-accepting chemotaxis protein|nr:methyl-accepting chemotaxis protein [Synergistaceae bacterium]